MSCLGPRLADLVDGRLGPVAAEQALAHAAGCARCRAELTAHRQVRALLARASAPGADQDLVERLAHLPTGTATDSCDPGPGSRSPRRPTGQSRGPGRSVSLAGGMSAVAAAMVAVAALVASGWGATGTAVVSPDPIRLVTPQLDSFTAEHAASIDRFSLAAPGTAVLPASYGPVSSGTRPAASAPQTTTAPVSSAELP